MSAKASRPATKQDIYDAFDQLMEELFKRVESSFSTNIDDLKEDLLNEIRHIRVHMVEMKTDMKMIRKMLEFWSRQNMAPEFMEKVIDQRILTSKSGDKHNN